MENSKGYLRNFLGLQSDSQISSGGMLLDRFRVNPNEVR